MPHRGKGQAAARPRQRRLGPYRLTRCLGSGAFAKVYAAIRHGDDAWVAVKVIPPEAECADSVRQRLLVEGHLMVGIDHPNLVRYLDVGEEDGSVFVVQELIDGGDITSLIALHHGEVPAELIATIGRDAARGLHALHQCGLLHRDVKPANLLLTRDGVCKVADLGLVRPLTEKGNITAAGLVVGTPSFIAPEQIRNDARLDGRADVYGLAASLYWLATGLTPHQAPNLWTMLQRAVTEPFPDPRLVRPDLSLEMVAVIRTAGDKDPELRHPTADAMAEDFDDILAGRTPRLAGLAVELRPQAKPAASVAAPTVLLVGSDPLLRRLYAGRLAVDGWQVEVSDRRDAACAALARHVPDLVVLDLLMLAEDGECFLRQIRALPGMASVPMVALIDAHSSGAGAIRSLALTRIVDKGSTNPRELSLLLRRLLVRPDRDDGPSLPVAGLAHAALDQLRPLLVDLDGEGQGKVLETLASSARGLACLSATVGLPVAVTIAEAVELLARHLQRHGAISSEAKRTLQRSVDALIAVITAQHPLPAWPPGVVLILDGDLLARRLALLALARARLPVACVRDWREALKAVAAQAVSLLLVEARQLEDPNAFVSAVRSRSSVPLLLAAPADTFAALPVEPGIDRVAKPYNAAELVARITTLLVVPHG